MEKELTIGQISKVTGLSRKSIRYYEKENLIPKASRSLAGYRLYTPKVVNRLSFIQKAKTIGFTLVEIRGILELSHSGKPCCNQVVSWTDKKLAQIDEQVKYLQQLKEKIIYYQKKWNKGKERPILPESEICGLLESIELPDEASKGGE